MNSIAEAFEVLDHQKEGIPFEAIEFLYNHPPNEEIQQKIIFVLAHAYDEDIYYDEAKDDYLLTPLWYAIVAENHLSEALIDLVIQLFTTTEDNWDFLDEQGIYLVGALAENFPDTMAEKALRAIEAQVAEESSLPYLFLFDFIYFIDIDKYKDRLLNLLKDERLFWFEGLLTPLTELQVKEIIPIIRNMLKRNDLDLITRNELEADLEELETDNPESKGLRGPYIRDRKPWREHYQPLDKYFYSDYEPEESPLAKKARELKEAQQLLDERESFRHQFSKIGRNERISVRYSDGKILNDVKFKKVEDDLLEGRCELI